MTPKAWIENARQNRDVLTALVASYHPNGNGPIPALMEITAPAAENARQAILATLEMAAFPEKRLTVALERGEIHEVYRILDETWNGIPESTAWRNIPGAREALHLLDSPPRV